MTTEIQREKLQVWAEDTEFVLDLHASPKREFARLAKIRGWVGGHEQWNIHWLLLFGEKYGYISCQHLPPATPTLATVLRTPEHTIRPEPDLKQDFFCISHNRSLQVGTKKWRSHWNKCFHQPWTSCGIACSYQAIGPASELQHLCFGVYDDFSLEKDANVAREFARLVREKGWDNAKAMKEQKWCFGAHINQNFSIVDSGSDSDWDLVSNSTTDSGRSVYAISHAGGMIPTSKPCPTTTLRTDFKELIIRQSLTHKSNLDASPAQHARIAAPSIAFKQPVAGQINAGKSKRQRRAGTLETDFCTSFGSDMTRLQGWQELCRVVGLPTDLKSVTQCKKALKNIYINLVNLVQHCRYPETTPLLKFTSEKEFREYTLRGDKSRVFPKAAAKKNTFLKALLQRVS